MAAQRPPHRVPYQRSPSPPQTHQPTGQFSYRTHQVCYTRLFCEFDFRPITHPTLPTFDLLTILFLLTCVSLFLSQGSPPHPTGLNSSTFLILNCPSSLVDISVQIFKICLAENHWVYSHKLFCYSSSKYYLVFVYKGRLS